MGASRLTAKSYTEEEIREIAERQNLVGYPHLALMREKLSVKAKNEPKFRFYNLKGFRRNSTKRPIAQAP